MHNSNDECFAVFTDHYRTERPYRTAPQLTGSRRVKFPTARDRKVEIGLTVPPRFSAPPREVLIQHLRVLRHLRFITSPRYREQGERLTSSHCPRSCSTRCCTRSRGPAR